MRAPRTLTGVFFLAGVLAAGHARAQFVSLSRCHSAYPCLIPFGVQYRPDPQLAGLYGQPGHTPVSGRIELRGPLKVEMDRPLDQKAIDAELRKSVDVRRPGTDAPAAAAPSLEKAPPEQMKPPGPDDR